MHLRHLLCEPKRPQPQDKITFGTPRNISCLQNFLLLLIPLELSAFWNPTDAFRHSSWGKLTHPNYKKSRTNSQIKIHLHTCMFWSHWHTASFASAVRSLPTVAFFPQNSPTYTTSRFQEQIPWKNRGNTDKALKGTLPQHQRILEVSTW